jgi:Uma2 family endonuclease
MVWVVNPRRRTVTVHRSLKDSALLTEEDELDGEDVIKGFQCRVAEIFI